MEATADQLLAALEEVASHPRASPDPGEPSPRPRPEIVPTAPTTFERPRRSDAAVIRMALKHLITENRKIRADLNALQGRDVPIRADAVEYVGSPRRSDRRP